MYMQIYIYYAYACTFRDMYAPSRTSIIAAKYEHLETEQLLMSKVNEILYCQLN